MPLAGNSGGYYDMMLSSMGLASPSAHSGFSSGGRRLLTPIQQAAAQHQQMLNNIPDVTYDSRFYGVDKGGNIVRKAAAEDFAQGQQAHGIDNPYVPGGMSAVPQADGGGTITDNPFVNTVPNRSVALSIADAAQRSNDPDYQNNLARALYASTGLPQEMSFRDQQRQQALQIATGEIQDGVKRARNMREGELDIRKARELYETGVITDSSYEKVVQDIVRKNPAAIGTAGYADYAGTQKQFQEKRMASMQAFSELHGAPQHHVTWDADADQPTFDTKAIGYDSAVATLRDKQAAALSKPAKDAIAAKRAATESGDRRLKIIGDLISKAGDNPPASLVQQYTSLSLRQFRAQQELESMITGGSASLAPQVPTEAPAAPRLTNVVPAATGKSYTNETVVTAVNSGQVKQGQTIYLNGQPVKLGTDGYFYPVR